MERDGLTRVYTVTPDNSWGRVVHPDGGKRLKFREVVSLLKRTDYRCLNRETYKLLPGGEWGECLKNIYDVTGARGKEEFEVNKIDWPSDERYARLAQALEDKAGKKGLTIVCS
jgi:hypothetical protein